MANTRIAPSPTGKIHIGTARTALFNFLYAKHTGGRCFLRIEDTDRERSTDENTQAIFDSFKWLGLDFDGEPVFQSAQADRHREVVQLLLDKGMAYECYMSPEKAKEWKAANKGSAFRSLWRDEETHKLIEKEFKISPVIRFKMPHGTTVINDVIKGSITFKNETLDDFVLLRSDGNPTYNLSVVVDDHDANIDVICRGDDHINNTPRQQLIYEAMVWHVPEFAHIPLIYGEDGKPLAKRHGAASVMDFADLGYLPEAMRNYLARLGWGHGNDEIFSDDQAIEWFDIKDALSSPARLDFKKLNNINAHYIKTLPIERLIDPIIDVINTRDVKFIAAEPWEKVTDLLRDSAPTINKLVDNMMFAISEITYDDKATDTLFGENVSKEGMKDVLDGLISKLEKVDDWSIATLYLVVHEYSDEKNILMKVLGPIIRSAITGKTVAPDLATILTAVGKPLALKRLEAAIIQ